MKRLWVHRAGIGVGATAALIAAMVAPARAGQSQTIAFPEITDQQVNETDYLQATATSGLDVVYVSETPDICVVDGSALTARQVGTCTVTATQPGNGTWDPAAPVSRSATMTQGNVNQGLAKPLLAVPVDDPVVFDFIVLPTRQWTGQVLPTGTYNVRVDTEAGDELVNVDRPFDPVTGTGQYVFNDPAPTPRLDPGWYVAFGCYNSDANYTGNDPECGGMGRPFQMYRYPSTTSVDVTPSTIRFGDSVTANFSVRDKAGQLVKKPGTRFLVQWLTPDGWDGVELDAEDGAATISTTEMNLGESVPVFAQFDDPTSEYSTSWQSGSVKVLQGVQKLSFAPLYDIEVGQTEGLVVDSNSDNPIDVDSDTPAICKVIDQDVKALKLGTCKVTATQEGTVEWEEAEPVTRKFDVVDNTVAQLSYPDGTTVVGQALTPLRPQLSGLKGTPSFTANGLPKGLSINKTTGVVSGTPTQPTGGPAVVTVIAKGDNGKQAGATFRITVKALPYPASVAYPQGQGWVDKDFTRLLPQVSGFTGPVTFRTDRPAGPNPLPSSGLPVGLSLDADTGAISGVPRQSGTFTPTVIASDGKSSVSTTVTLVISKSNVTPKLTYPAKTKAVVGVPMSVVRPHAVGLGKQVTFSAKGLPKGVKVTAKRGLVRGTPVKHGTYTVKVTASGSQGKAKAHFSLKVHKSPLRLTVSYPDVRVLVGAKLSPVKPVVVGAHSSLKFSAKKVPTGLTLNKKTGVLSGNPKKAGGSSVRVTVRDSDEKAKTTFVVEVMKK